MRIIIKKIFRPEDFCSFCKYNSLTVNDDVIDCCQTYFLPGKLFGYNFASRKLTDTDMSGCKLGVGIGILLLMLVLPVTAQDIDTGEMSEVSGIVTDEFGEPLAGAAVVVRGLPVSQGGDYGP